MPEKCTIIVMPFNFGTFFTPEQVNIMSNMFSADINECLDPHSHQCSDICINMDGSYRCECPPDKGLRLALNGTHCEPSEIEELHVITTCIA